MSPFLTGVYLFGLSGALLLFIFMQHRRGAVEIMSIRNVALVGFILFQLSSAAIRLVADRYEMFRMSDPGAAGVELALMSTVFIPILLLAYRIAPGVRTPAKALAADKQTIGEGFMLGMAVILTALTLVFRFGVLIPYVAIFTNMVAVGFAAVSSGLIGWVWARRLLNPAVLLTAVLVLSANTALVMWGEFGRRNLVAVGAGLIWGMYYGHWRYITFGRMLIRMTAVSIVPIVFLALYTSVRSSGDGQRSTMGHLQEMASGNVKEGVVLLFDGQNTGTAALWCIENYPENYEYDHLFTIQYFFLLPIPRALWETKPAPLSTKLASLANVRGVDQGKVTLPAGIIGNAAAEGGWYALVVYAFVSGVFLRFFDELIRRNPWSPFVVLPVGCQLGQVLGLARGETSVFANTYVLAFIGVWVSMSLTAKLLDAFGVSRDAGAFADAGEEEQDWSHYGDESWQEAHTQPGDPAA
ncbi:MAG: hypothetical protein ACF8QF_12730 [Phycisphaerales bacterium]